MGGAVFVTYRFIRDVQGSVRLIVDAATGAIAQRLDYDSFGRVLLDTAPSFQPFGFQSGLYDPDTGLVQFGARWYDASTGRWLSKDPILLEGGLNLYVFCGNDPVNFADPWGLCEADEKISTIQRYLCSNPLLPTGINIFAPDTFALGNNTYVIAGGFYYHSGLFQNNHMDVKAQQPFKKWEVPRQGTMRSDSFGNYLAGYYAGYSGKPSVYILMRAGGFMHSSIGVLMKTCGVVGTAEHWTDRDSVPDINAGFKDGLIDRLFGRDRR